MLTMPDDSYEQLADLDVLVMNALRPALHPTHQNLVQALDTAKRISAKETYFIHYEPSYGFACGCSQRASSTCPFIL